MRGIIVAHWAVIVGILALGLNGCKPESDFKKDAGKAATVAKDAIVAIRGGTLSYGDYDRLNSQINQMSETISACPKSEDPSEAASQSLFDSSWALFESKFSLMGTTKFLDERMRAVGTGGISPAYTAQVGVDEISGMEDAVNTLTDSYKKLN